MTRTEIEHGLNDIDPLPADASDLGENQAALIRLVKHFPMSLVGGFWRIEAWLDSGGGVFRGTVFLSGLDARTMGDHCFYFLKCPVVGRREVIKVKSTGSILSMVPGHIAMTPKEDITFKLNVMLGPAYCSPELLPRLFSNIRDLHESGAMKVDWQQMLETLPASPPPGSNWEMVRHFVRQMSEG